MPPHARSVAVVVGSTVVLLAGVACSGGIDVSVGGSKGISAQGVEEEISDRATELSDSAPESVACAAGLDAEVGATTTCEMVHDGVRATLALETTEVSEEEALDFSWQVEPGSQRLLTDRVGDTIAEAFAAQTGLTLTELSCPEPELEATSGAVMTCEAGTADGRSGPVVLTVRGAEGMRVDFGWRLGDP